MVRYTNKISAPQVKCLDNDFAAFEANVWSMSRYEYVLNTISDSTAMNLPNLDSETIDRIIEMAWEDRTPFEAIEQQFGLQEKQVIALMRREMKASSFKMWRERVTGRKTKHLKQRDFVSGRFHSQNQKGS